jgi:glutathione S-transferase
MPAHGMIDGARPSVTRSSRSCRENALAIYYSVEAARRLPGLRLVVTAHMPGLWSEGAKGVLDAKKIPYVLVEQEVGGENRALLEWTAQTSAPVAVWNDERPRSSWLEQLYLAERLSPTPALIPQNLDHRVTMFGLCNELAGENGFAWNMRLTSFHRMLNDPAADDFGQHISRTLAPKYGYDPALVDSARQQMIDLVAQLRERFREQRHSGRRYLVGDALSALDIYWATFAGAIDPLPPDLCPNMPAVMRQNYTDPELKALAGPELIQHRDFIYATYLKLPMDF